MLKDKLENVRKKSPLIHNITNYVTVNDCANILLACGASPIMADDIYEVEEITTLSEGLYINIGTLNHNTIPAMFLAGKKANELNHPVILDPVGAGASKLRTEITCKLLDDIKFTAIRGNISEIRTLANGNGSTKGVDADITDIVTEVNLNKTIDFVKEFAMKTDTIIAITGAIDIVTDGNFAYVIRNGHKMMSKITGTGCMLTAMTTAYLVANINNPLEAAVASLCAMGLSGERALDRLNNNDGNATYRNYIIDEIYNLDGITLENGAKYEIR